MEVDWECEYDSTWDTESDGEGEPVGESQTRRSCQDKNKLPWTLWHHTPRNMRAAKDMQNYRRGYPNLTDDECSEDKMSNLKFYLNQFPSAPDDVYIESFHKEWKTDYKRLERVHSYIQWLFPLREPGVNYMASELTKKEIEAFKKSDDAKRRLVESYELMLGFYGMQLVNREVGEVRRAENWKERFGNLERNMHNNLRITRILKSLGELGFGHYQAPLVQFFLEETLVKKTLSSVKRSVLDYFLFAVLDKQKRQELVRFAYMHFEPKEKFVWCPRKIQKQFRKAEKKSEAFGSGEGKEEASSNAKGKDLETSGAQKEDAGGTDNNAKVQKGADKAAARDKAKAKASEASSTEPKPNAAVENGKEATESDNELMDNEDSCVPDGDEMDQSTGPDTVTVKSEHCVDGEHKSSSKPKDATQGPVSDMQMNVDALAEKPPVGKKEDDKVSNDGPVEDISCGQAEDKASANKATGQTTPSASTPHKTSKHSPSLSSEREEKIPRTDYNHVPDTKDSEEMLAMASASPANGVPTHLPGTSVDEQTLEAMDVESNSPDSDQKVENS